MLPLILPLAALLGVGILVLSLGNLFLALGHIGTIIAGLVIIVLVPLVGLLLTRSGNESAS